MTRVTPPGRTLIIALLLGLATLLTGCGGSGSSSDMPSGPLTAASDTPIREAVTDLVVLEPYPAEQFSVDDHGRTILRTELRLMFHETATSGEVNVLLAKYGATLVGSIAGTPSLIVRIPDPGDLSGLEALVAQLQAEPIIWHVGLSILPEPAALPSNVTPPEVGFVLKSQQAVKAPAAWNASAAIQHIPTVFILDYFGYGPPNTDLNATIDAPRQFMVSPLSPSDPLCAVAPPAENCPNAHGYHVAGIIAGFHGGAANTRQQVTGMHPGTVKLLAVDLTAQYGWQSVLNFIVEKIKRIKKLEPDGRVILNTSMTYKCTGIDGFCVDPKTAMADAVYWADVVRTADVEDYFLHLTAAGNIQDPPDLTIRHATTASEFNAAALLELHRINPADGSTVPVPNLSNILVIENDRAQVSAIEFDGAGKTVTNWEVKCLSDKSFVGGNLGAIGTDVWSFYDADTAAGEMTGTSMATPQVAGLAAYLWSVERSHSPQALKALLKQTAYGPIHKGGDCSDWAAPAPTIDAYAALLALDRHSALPGESAAAAAPIRMAILDVVGNDKAFNAEDLNKLLLGGDNNYAITQPTGTLNFGRHDLNGDGYTGGEKTARFDLNMDGSYGSVIYTFNGQDATLNEAALTDLQILCYYAYSPLFSDDNAAKVQRDTLLAEHAAACGTGSGKIAFMSTRDGTYNYEIYVMNADGTGQTNLTQNPAVDFHQVWSPDGRRIAFLSERDGGRDIYVMNADGTGLTKLTQNSGFYTDLKWSPDSSRIAFLVGMVGSSGNRDIYVMNADGTGQTNLTQSSADDTSPAWSPDGSRIAFAIRGDLSAREVYVMNADGTGQTNLTQNPADDYGPAWSPDGSRIVFLSLRHIINDIYVSDIYVMNADGTGQTNLTNFTENSGFDPYLIWSPDGSRIAFVTSFVGSPGNYTTEIYVMNADGTGLTNLTQNSAYDNSPTWSPDGSRIAFVRMPGDGSAEIYVMNADGTEQTKLTDTTAVNSLPRWQPVPFQ